MSVLVRNWVSIALVTVVMISQYPNFKCPISHFLGPIPQFNEGANSYFSMCECSQRHPSRQFFEAELLCSARVLKHAFGVS